MSWYKITLTAKQVLDGEDKKLVDGFDKIFMAVGGPKEMALFSTGFLNDDTIEYYFSPGSLPHVLPLIAGYAGVKCDKPSPKEAGLAEDFGLEVGHADASDLLE